VEQGDRMFRLIEELYPICRSITGEGLRQSLRIIGRRLPLVFHEVPTGTELFDWTVPREWNVRGASIATLDGRRVIDFADHNLHLLQYSTPVNRVVSRDELFAHLHTLPETPDWIPYRTSYYNENWGFCLSARQAEGLHDEAYRVVIDTTLAPGHLTYGELLIEGEREEEVLLSCHCCHPSLANDNLAGIAVAVALAERLREHPRRFTYRFLFIPGTIGSLAWLKRNEHRLDRIRHGLVLSCLGDGGPLNYKETRSGEARIDRIMAHILRHAPHPSRTTPFVPYGYDERQYSSPGFDLPVGCFTRSPNGGYPEYHSSADNLDLVRPEHLVLSLETLWQAVEVIEHDRTYLSLNPKGEPQLGKRGLYRPIMGQKDGGGADQLTLLWILNLADGKHSLLDVAERAGVPFAAVREGATALADANLLQEINRI